MIPCMIVPILVGPDILRRMLDTIDYPVAKLIIIDNGDALRYSGPWPVEHVQSTKIIKMPANLGVAGSWNLGIKAAPFAPWWLITNFDVEWPSGSLQAFAEQASGEDVLLAQSPQPYCAFAVGEDVVQRVGLFDEAFHPAYFEDNDYDLRCAIEGVKVKRSTIPVMHHNSSTIGYFGEINNRTYASNAEYMNGKRSQPGPGGWSLERRRVNSWD
jgi:GT2 family glycosyltransferase